MCPRSIAGVPSSQAHPGFLITAPPFVCVPDVLGALACGFQTKKYNKKACGTENTVLANVLLAICARKHNTKDSMVSESRGNNIRRVRG